MATDASRSHRLIRTLVGISLFFLSTSYFASAQPSSDVVRLIDQLHDTSPDKRRTAALELGNLGPAAKTAIPDLVKLLKDPNETVRWAPALALGRLGPVAKDSAPDLAETLKDPNMTVRWAAATALDQIGPVAKKIIPDLLNSLKDPAETVRRAAADALGRLGPAAKDVIPDLLRLLKDRDEGVQRAAATTLGGLGPVARDAVSDLLRLLKDPDVDTRWAALQALVGIGETIADRSETDVTYRRQLEEALKLLESPENRLTNPFVTQEFVKRINRAINHLKALERAYLIDRFGGWLQTVSFKDWKTWAVIVPAGWLLFLFAVFLLKPLWLPKWNEALKESPSIKIKPGGTESSLPIPVRHILLISLFAYRRRVLDAWVKTHVGRCRENFDEFPTVKDRIVHVPSPVKVDGSLVPEFSAATLRAYIGKARQQCHWLIFGEGGVGKTSLACQMARWAMAQDKANRLAPQLMLPVLIEDELDNPATPKEIDRFTEAIRGKLRALIGSPEPISPELLTNLLRHSRVLVIVDHFTEMSQATRDQIRFDAPEFPVAALVVTARTDATLENHPKHRIEPIRIQGTRLSVFIDAYLNARKTRDGFKARDLFDDEEYFEACKQLSRMAGERDITVLLAKLYADQMVAAKERPDTDDLPKTIPALMLRYLSELNRNLGSEENRVVHHDCKAIAWECLKTTYRSGPARRTTVMEALKGDGDDEQYIEARLNYLIDRLRVIQVTGTAEDHIRFVLDPLAEYLAGMEVVEKNRGDKTKWGRFLENADRKPGAPEDTSGFVLAVRDCCLTSPDGVPDFVPDELAKRGGLDPELVRQLQLKQRVRRYIEDLRLPNAYDRQHAAEVLSDLGPAAGVAAPELVKLLKDPEANVRKAAKDALGRLGPAARHVIPSLVKFLSDPEALVRGIAAYALSRFGPAAEAAIPSLVKLLDDPKATVRRTAAEALGRLGPAAGAAIPALVKSLSDHDAFVRRAAIVALGRQGPAAKDTIPDMVNLLKDTETFVRRAAAAVLDRLGSAARTASPSSSSS